MANTWKGKNLCLTCEWNQFFDVASMKGLSIKSKSKNMHLRSVSVVTDFTVDTCGLLCGDSVTTETLV